jgi:hypothetical protein
MEEAKEYKAYLKALKEATKKKPTNFIKRRKELAGIKTIKLSEGGMCRGMGAAVKGGNFKGVT